ncbi:NADH-quinone oxidoreductase subunit A [Colwellia sp. C1TZA3]|uniref:NADH-quinone oxidoreductase subunit A n=1 Tax=Colwellia sp. C1TZA3 TaxID=2508879 RepID=UPI001CB8F2CC|nr:NADH-quinone oxidoreductase subunit A [Colwellia sp. C1TZA3]
METSDQITQVWPIAAYFIILAGMLIVMMLLSHFLGPKGKQRAKDSPYESGIISVSDNKTRFTNHFFLYAIFFVIFDLETIYLFAWVIAFDEVGWPGFIEASIFITVLLAALIYLVRIGALALTHRHQPFRARQLQRLQQAESQPAQQSLFDKVISDKTISDKNKGQQ